MIKLAQKNKIKKVLKCRFTKEVQEILNEKGIVNKNGKPFCTSFISHVFNGRYENLAIEETIIELYQKKVKEQKEISNRRKEILNA